jgi:hypothetical protein
LLSSTISNYSPLLDRKIEKAVAGLKKQYERKLRSAGESNAATIADYISAMKSEINLSDNYRRDTIEALVRPVTRSTIICSWKKRTLKICCKIV